MGAIDAVHHSACQARPTRQKLHALQVLGVSVCVLCVWSFVIWAMESVCVCVGAINVVHLSAWLSTIYHAPSATDTHLI